MISRQITIVFNNEDYNFFIDYNEKHFDILDYICSIFKDLDSKYDKIWLHADKIDRESLLNREQIKRLIHEIISVNS